MNEAAKQKARQRLLVGLAILVLGIYALFSVLDAGSASARLQETRGDLAELKQKLAEIDRMKEAPRVAALQLESPAEITNRISAARSAAGLPQSSLLREEPLDPQRIGRSDFELRSTTIKLAPSTLPQIMKFCDALRDQQTGTLVRDIRLSEPQNGATGGDEERWEAELVLTQMIFSPKSR